MPVENRPPVVIQVKFPGHPRPIPITGWLIYEGGKPFAAIDHARWGTSGVLPEKVELVGGTLQSFFDEQQGLDIYQYLGRVFEPH
jgi:hypothetical protein